MKNSIVKRITVFITLIAVFSAFTVGSFACSANYSKVKHAKKKVLMVIAPKNFEDVEFFTPKALLEKSGAKVTVASTSTDIATGSNGGTFKPDKLISKVNVANYDAVVVIGGAGSIECLWDDIDLRKCIIEAYKRNKVVAAICAATVTLAKAGILKGKDATTYPWNWDGAVNELKANGANFVNAEVVVSGKIVTGRDPDASKAFGLKLCEVLGFKK